MPALHGNSRRTVIFWICYVCTIGNLPRRKPTRELQAAVIPNHENVNIRNIVQGEAQHRKYKRFKLGGGQV
jgi:hypothetical protein